jgi:hypothetical protein
MALSSKIHDLPRGTNTITGMDIITVRISFCATMYGLKITSLANSAITRQKVQRGLLDEIEEYLWYSVRWYSRRTR